MHRPQDAKSRRLQSVQPGHRRRCLVHKQKVLLRPTWVDHVLPTMFYLLTTTY